LIILNSSLCYSYHINNVSGVILADNPVVCHVKQHDFYPSGHPFAFNETWRCASRDQLGMVFYRFAFSLGRLLV
ncbi:MAG: hypothetical protein AB1516_13850, partial [Pseudomonadota bacterium]